MTMTQGQARAAAREWNTAHPDDERAAVASQDPPGSWGGTTDEWTVTYLLKSAFAS